MKNLLLLFISVLMGLSVVGCNEDKDSSRAMERIESAYKLLNVKHFDDFMDHWSEGVKGEDAGFSNYIEINEFYRVRALNNDVMGVGIEYYNCEKESGGPDEVSTYVIDYKETITSAKDGKKVPLERVLRIWVKPLGKNFKIIKVKLMPVPEGAGGSFL